MPLTESEELELLELENENALSEGDVRDAPAPVPQGIQSASEVPERLRQAVMTGFMQRDLPPGAAAGEKVAAAVGRYGPPIAASMATANPAAGLAVRAGMAGLSAGGAELARQGLRVATGEQDVPGALKESGATGLSFAAGEGIVGGGIKLAGSAFKRLSQTIGGISEDAFERLVARPKDVMSKISRDPEAKEGLVEQFKAAVKENIHRASDAYDDLIQKVVGGEKYGPGFKLNLMEGVGDDLAKIQQEFGYGVPGRLGKEGADAEVFNQVNKAVQSLQSATPQEAYLLQRDINRIARDKAGTSLGVALGRAKRSIQRFLGESIPEIGEANRIYARAAQLDEAVDPLLNRKDVAKAIKSAFKNKTSEKAILEEVADEIPKARQALEAIRDNAAGTEFSPAIGQLPRTGLTAGLGALGIGAAGGNPLALAGAAVAAPFLSPRLIGQSALAANYIRSQVGSVPARATAAGTGSALAEAYLRRRAP